MRAVEPSCRFIWADPLIHVAPRDRSRAERKRANDYRLAQFESYDLLMGRLEPELGGHAERSTSGPQFPPNQWYITPHHPNGQMNIARLEDMLRGRGAVGKTSFLARAKRMEHRPAGRLLMSATKSGRRLERGIDSVASALPNTAYPGGTIRATRVGLFGTPGGREPTRVRPWSGSERRALFAPVC